jgi:hypothetical protein
MWLVNRGDPSGVVDVVGKRRLLNIQISTVRWRCLTKLPLLRRIEILLESISNMIQIIGRKNYRHPSLS